MHNGYWISVARDVRVVVALRCNMTTIVIVAIRRGGADSGRGWWQIAPQQGGQPFDEMGTSGQATPEDGRFAQEGQTVRGQIARFGIFLPQ